MKLFHPNTILITLCIGAINIALFAQGPFSPPAGQQGSTAIHKDSPLFKGWAVGCEVFRGFKDTSNPQLGYATIGDCNDVVGKAGEKGVLSLGDGGFAILRFDPPIKNGQGYDFAVFENSFDDYFLELAFVEVSSDGENFYRFPSTSLTPTDNQIGPFENTDATNINNLAGKYRIFHGVPFDLSELTGNAGLNTDSIHYIKIIDVVGSINQEYASFDSHGNIINDPWPTPFPSSGFDLDAIGVINNTSTDNESFSVSAYPNPVTNNSKIRVYAPFEANITLQIINLSGKVLWSEINEVSYTGMHFFDIKQNIELKQGLYFVKLLHDHGVSTFKIIVF
ncbi:MAG: T9SS type A sorting domain-containing protein [Bacteroidetes bacterium]|nr:T9SS type A sorting domain-containing protein [Bacteroidota bacterium]